MSEQPEIKNLVWIDLEMTGLDPVKDEILQVACIVTDTDLNTLEGELNLAIHFDETSLQQMGEWQRNQYTKTGLWQKCLDSQFSTADVQQQTIEFISKYVQAKQSPMCGSSIAWDRAFLKVHMPQLHDYFHYRSIDVSTVKQLFNLWSDQPEFVEEDVHDAVADIRESVAELKYYRENFLSNHHDRHN